MVGRRSVRTSALAVVLVAGLALAGCGGNSDASDRIDLQLVSTTAAGATTTTGASVGTGSTTTGSTAPLATIASPPTVQGDGDEAYVAALQANFQNDPDNKNLMDATQATCVAPKWVATITADRLRSSMTPNELAAQSSMNRISSLGLGVAETKTLADELAGCGVDVRAALLAGIGDATVETCMKDKITEAIMRDVLAGSLTGTELTDPELVAARDAYTQAQIACTPTG